MNSRANSAVGFAPIQPMETETVACAILSASTLAGVRSTDRLRFYQKGREPMATDRRSMLVTFKRKDQRPERNKDKVDIVRSVLTQGIDPHFFNAMTLPMGSTLPMAAEAHLVGYDVNQYEVPIVTAHLTSAETDALRKNGNVAMVEEDMPCYAIGPFDHLAVENQPSVLAETIPTGVAQISAPAAWDYSQGKDIRVAVVDTGIDFTHPDLRPNYRGGISFVPGAANRRKSSMPFS